MSSDAFDEHVSAKDVAVKILVDSSSLYINVGHDKLPRLESELKFLQDPMIRGHPNLPKVIGCCREGEILGIVYDLNPDCTLHDLITRDDFTWLKRVNTAVKLALLLDYLHDFKSPHLIRNLDPAHIVFDQDFAPILFEFGMLVGGVLGTTISLSEKRAGTFGYIDPYVALCGPAAWTVKSDVYAFGVVLLSLISKRVVDKNNALKTAVSLWALKEYKPRCSLVHQSLKCDPDSDSLDGPKVTKLAMQCIADVPTKRPTMKEVVKGLKALHVVQQHGG